MNSPILQLLVLAGIAIFLILRLRSVLGTREGFEKPPVPRQRDNDRQAPELEVIESGPDHDIIDHVPEDSDAAKALAKMKRIDNDFSVRDFLQGARGAYEMILTAFENGEMADIKPFLSDDVYEAFAEVVESRNEQGLNIDFTFVGVSELKLADADFDDMTNEAELTVRFIGEMTSVVRDRAGDVIEGSATDIKRQRDVWTFARKMGTSDPNWTLVATGE
ncbi:Tim44/TimA family putative adaptor protein [Salibaculum griseiflavum]|jgi:predicted lipid-binding transport protein (Tim44 family)|uniref:Preprotein translocase subunit Tim44 n=1 Tax=Salibaculum griseiflavum TaxID=1914409 RepID=A0A2V1P3J3_9RHOB|nr:Tim44/TimA family putative adaptor protein [Salibaculum griseiflavum]PWG17071.1 preprotein translocase subunit Tim44 [Salibaculum griseiflavum]